MKLLIEFGRPLNLAFTCFLPLSIFELSDFEFGQCKVQRIFQIGAVKKLLQDKGGEQAASVKVLKRHFDQNLEIKSGEAATEHMIQTAIALWNSLFSVPRLKVAWPNSMCVCVNFAM